MSEDIIDYGEVTIPTKWEDISLKKYQDISRFYGDERKKSLIELLPILIDKDKDYIMQLPVEFLDKILNMSSFILTDPDVEPNNEIIIDGEKYIINYQNKLRTGEYIAVDTVIKDDPYNYAGIIAILARKANEPYDSKFENEVLDDRIALFEKQPMMNVLPLFFSLLSLYTMLKAPTLLSSSIRVNIDHILKNIEDLAKDGEVSKRSMKSARKKLIKLRESINFT